MASIDVLIVGLGATHGLRAAEDELAGSLLRAGAEAMLRKVRATEMFGFYEFDMATYFLEQGPPVR